MTKQFSSLIFSAITLSLITGCGGGGTDPSVPKSIISGITDDYTITRGANLTLDGLSSTDDIKIINYTWMIDDKIVSTSATDKLLVIIPVGKHKVCLTTEDADKKSNMVCKNIKVIEQKVKTPTAIINNIPNSGWKTKCKITINAKESTANFERTIKSYKWLKDGAEIGTDINQTFEFNSVGPHNITLEVTDNKGEKDSTTKSVQIAQIGHPTAKLTLVNVLNKPIFSEESNQDGKIWERNEPVPDTNTPQKSNYVFISATGSFDDCNLTDDNLSFKWDSTILDANGNNAAPSSLGLGYSCFHNKSELRSQVMKFNGTQIVSLTNRVDGDTGLPELDKNNAYKDAYKFPFIQVVDGTIGGWDGWKGWRDEKWEKAYISMCTVGYNYTSLKITLTVIDHLHDINTTVTKVVETRYTDTQDSTGKIIDVNNPSYTQ